MDCIQGTPSEKKKTTVLVPAKFGVAKNVPFSKYYIILSIHFISSDIYSHVCCRSIYGTSNIFSPSTDSLKTPTERRRPKTRWAQKETPHPHLDRGGFSLRFRPGRSNWGPMAIAVLVTDFLFFLGGANYESLGDLVWINGFVDEKMVITKYGERRVKKTQIPGMCNQYSMDMMINGLRLVWFNGKSAGNHCFFREKNHGHLSRQRSLKSGHWTLVAEIPGPEKQQIHGFYIRRFMALKMTHWWTKTSFPEYSRDTLEHFATQKMERE